VSTAEPPEAADPLTIIPVRGVPEVRGGDLLAELIAGAAEGQGTPLEDRDCLVVTQKVVSKAEGRLVPLGASDLDGRRRLIEQESRRILRRRGDLVISETFHGFVCANAGIDLSNIDDGAAALLPIDSDRSARRIRDVLRARRGVDVAVLVSDTFGRAWRQGLTDVVIGVAGFAGVVDLRGSTDERGRELMATEVAVADEVAGAAELAMGKAAGIPAAIVRGLDPTWFREGSVTELVRPPAEDLFR
jgi:coenzyme F420-0:L-glutamate ligase/coenzyme F420-1:gamma-L-glutamate ligase